MSELAKNIGERIRTLRKERGMSQEELAFKASSHASYIGQLERGEKNITLESLENIIHALNISFEELFKFMLPQNSESRDYSVLASILNCLYTRSVEDHKAAYDVINRMLDWKDTSK